MKSRLLLLLALMFSTVFAAEPSLIPADPNARIAAAKKLADDAIAPFLNPICDNVPRLFHAALYGSIAPTRDTQSKSVKNTAFVNKIAIRYPSPGISSHRDAPGTITFARF